MEIFVLVGLVAGVFFICHGIVFLIWGPVYWKAYTIDGLPYSTSVIWQRVDIGEAGIRFVGLLWLLSGVGWIVAGIALMFDVSWWQGMTVAVALLSSIVCVLAMPEGKYGLLINLVIVGLVYLNGLYAWV